MFNKKKMLICVTFGTDLPYAKACLHVANI